MMLFRSLARRTLAIVAFALSRKGKTNMKRALVATLLLMLASYPAAAQNESSTRAYFGVQLQPGALVGAVEENGPAQAAGIAPGDLIISFDGKVIKSSDELLQAVAAGQIGKEVVIAVVRRGKEGMTTATLGQRLVLSGAALDEYRRKLDGILQELGSLGASTAWGRSELQKFSDLLGQFDELKKAAPPEEGVARNLWDRLDREFQVYKLLADNVRRQREAQRDQSPEAMIEEQLGPLYVDYMMLQVCAARFQEFEKARAGFREFLKNKQAAFPADATERLWNAVAVKFQKVESALDRTGAVQLYGACEQASKQAAALVTPVAAEQTSGPPLRRKDF